MTIYLVFERRFRDDSPTLDTAWDSEQAAIGHVQLWIQTKPRPLAWQEVPIGSSSHRRIWTNGDQDLILEPVVVQHGSWLHGIEETHHCCECCEHAREYCDGTPESCTCHEDEDPPKNDLTHCGLPMLLTSTGIRCQKCGYPWEATDKKACPDCGATERGTHPITCLGVIPK